MHDDQKVPQREVNRKRYIINNSNQGGHINRTYQSTTDGILRNQQTELNARLSYVQSKLLNITCVMLNSKHEHYTK